MGMVFCRGCGKEIHESAPTCPQCGALQGKSSSKGELPYTSYDQVPWYRKNWFAIICFLIFPPGLLLILLTGGAYYTRKGVLRRYSVAAKVFLIILALLYIAKLGGTVYQYSANGKLVTEIGSHEMRAGSLIVVDSADVYTFDRSTVRAMLINKDLYAMLEKGSSETGDYIACAQMDTANNFAAKETSTATDELQQNFATDATTKQATYVGFGCRMGSAADLASLTKQSALATPAEPVLVSSAPADTPVPTPAPDNRQQPEMRQEAVSQPSEAEILSKYKASFDCDKASTDVEKLTCSTTTLNQLDGLLARTYKERMTDPAFGVDKAAFKADQLTWVKTRNSCGDADCLEKSYRQRIADLCGMPVISGVHPGGDCDVIQN